MLSGSRSSTTVQPKAISFPTDAKLLHAAINGLNRLARKHGVRLRQSYLRIAKRAAMMAGRYAHAKQFNRHRRQLRILRTRLGRIIRDIRRKIVGQHLNRNLRCEVDLNYRKTRSGLRIPCKLDL